MATVLQHIECQREQLINLEKEMMQRRVAAERQNNCNVIEDYRQAMKIL